MQIRSISIITLILVLFFVTDLSSAQEHEDMQMLADFEVETLFRASDENGNNIGFVSWGDAANSIELGLVTADADIMLSDQESENIVLRVTYDIAQFGGFSHVLNDGTLWTSQDWTAFTTFEFWLYGTTSGAPIQVEIFDNRAEASITDTAERWFYRLVDDFEGWQQVRIPFESFQRRSDWQPGGAPNDGLGLDQVHGYAFSFPAGVGENTTYIDNIALSNPVGNVAMEDEPMATSEPEIEGDTEPPTLAFESLEYDPDGDWQLVWSDEFDAEINEPINADYWTCELGGHGWGNNQLEYNTDRIENVYHTGDGYLAITAYEEAFEGNGYTSGRCNTNDKVEFTYGKVEARIDLPEGQGMWPAFWMLGAEFPEVNWPDVGEIDIMEYVGNELRSTHGTIHGPGYSSSAGLSSRYIHEGPAAEGFHIYGIEWEPDVIRFYVDDDIYFTVTPDSLYQSEWVFNNAFFIIINVAVGGNWPGSPDETTVFPQSMLVDWVRIYQRQ